jgi:hypothetical protein
MHPTHVLIVGQKNYNENGGDTQAFLDGNNGLQQQHGQSNCNSFSLTSLIFSFLQVVFQDSHSFSYKLFLKLLHFLLQIFSFSWLFTVFFLVPHDPILAISNVNYLLVPCSLTIGHSRSCFNSHPS